MLTILLALMLSTLSPCPTEDSSPCYWDATRGNGTGHSFLALSEDVRLYLD